MSEIKTKLLTDIQKDIILKLLYSEVFQHPLKTSEIGSYLREQEPEKIKASLEELSQLGVIGKKEDYYFVFDEGNKIERRKNANEKAQNLLPKAYRVAKRINKFPYVEGVGISGSLSKGVLHDDGDFDFFIVTKPQRLWVARTSLVLFKKLFLLNSRKYFCVNYFVDSENLEIAEKNTFTATEIGTLIPASGKVLNDFFEKNNWVEGYFPNLGKNRKPSDDIKKPWWSKLNMWILSGKLGEWTDEKLMQFTLKNWNKKFGTFEQEKFDLTMKTRKYISKHHPNDFQNKVLNKYQDLIEKFKTEHQDQLQKMEIEL